MTREEAIEFGNMWLEMNQDSKDSNTYAFFDMAIKVLQLIPDIETVLHNSSYITNDEYEDEVIEVELIQRILDKVKEEVIE